MDLKKLISDYIVELPPDKPKAATAPATAAAPAVAPSGIPGLPGGTETPVYVTRSGPAPAAYVPPTEIDSTLSPKFAEKIQSAYTKSPAYALVQRFTKALETLAKYVPEGEIGFEPHWINWNRRRNS